MDPKEEKKKCPQPVKEAGAVIPPEQLRERENLRVTRSSLRREAVDGVTLTKADVTVALAGRVNRNGRLYPKAAWEAAINAAQADIEVGKLWGLLEHEEGDWYGYGPAKGRLRNIAMSFESLYMEADGTVKGVVTLPDTEAGNTLRGLLEAGVAVGISSSGRASQKYLPAGEVLDDPVDPEELIAVIQDDFRLDTIDAVGDPSDPSGLIKAIESLQSQGERGADPPPAPAPTPNPPEPAPVPPTQTPQEESYMHPKLKALLERLGKSLEQVKSENATEYLACLEDIAADRADLTESAGRVPGLENEVTRLKQEAQDAKAALEREQAERRREQRTALVDRAIAAAGLPLLDPYKDGDKEVDLNAEFRNDLVESAVAAESDAAAETLVGSRVARRKHELGARPAGTPAAAPSLPEGKDPADDAEQVRESAVPAPAFVQRLRS